MQYAITQRYRRCYNTPVNVQCVDNLSLILGWSVYTLWMPIKYVTIFYNFSPWMLVVCTVVESAKLMKPPQKHRESKQYSPSLFSALFFLFLVFLLHLPFPVSVSVLRSTLYEHASTVGSSRPQRINLNAENLKHSVEFLFFPYHRFCSCICSLTIYMKKLPASHWLKASAFFV